MAVHLRDEGKGHLVPVFFSCVTVSVEGAEGSWGQANGGGEAGAE